MVKANGSSPPNYLRYPFSLFFTVKSRNADELSNFAIILSIRVVRSGCLSQQSHRREVVKYVVVNPLLWSSDRSSLLEIRIVYKVT